MITVTVGGPVLVELEEELLLLLKVDVIGKLELEEEELLLLLLLLLLDEEVIEDDEDE